MSSLRSRHICLHGMLALVAFCVSSLVLGEDSDVRITPIGGGSGCTLARSNAPSNAPILFDSTGKIYPKNENNGDILIADGARFDASCTLNVSLKDFGVNQIALQCRAGQLVVLPGQTPTTFANLGCEKALLETVDEQTNGNCPNFPGQTRNISIEYNTATRKLPLITLCHDYDQFNTLMSKHTIYGGSIAVAETSNKRPSFKKAQFYSSVKVADVYSQANQKDAIRKLLGSSKLADEYINYSQSFYFARGHLSPDGDFFYVSEQNATYYYVNVIPQWQAINNGNWKAMEMAVRKLAQNYSTDVHIYTGGFGILKLKDVNENPVEIYLDGEPPGKLSVPVPRLTWKIIHVPSTKSAVAIVMVNNPHDLGVTSEDIICTDKCKDVKFVTWDIQNTRKGYTYCCDVVSFKKAVKYAPSFGRGIKLLTN